MGYRIYVAIRSNIDMKAAMDLCRIAFSLLDHYGDGL